MRGRLGGAVVLLVALLGIVALPRLTTFGVAGVASVDPGPPPLPVGTCLRNEVSPEFSPSGWMLPVAGLEPVSCDEPHWGEVFVVDDDRSGRGESGSRLMSACWRSAALVPYVRGADGVADWLPVFGVDRTALGPDAQQFAGGQRWATCIASGDAPLTGSLAGVGADGTLPAALGLCYIDDFASIDSIDTSCRRPHRGELFGYRDLDLQRPPTQTQLDADCRALADRASGRPGLADEPGVAVSARAFVWFDDQQSRFDSLPVPDDAEGAALLCGVRAVDGRSFTASLRGIGGGSLPWEG